MDRERARENNPETERYVQSASKRTNLHIRIYTYVYIYIRVYRERERESQTDTQTHRHVVQSDTIERNTYTKGRGHRCLRKLFAQGGAADWHQARPAGDLGSAHAEFPKGAKQGGWS